MRVALLAVLCSCDFTFQLDHLELPPDDGSLATDGPSLPGCMSATPSDDFPDSAVGCGAWADVERKLFGANAVRANGHLWLSPADNMAGTEVSCLHSNYDLAQGVMIEVLSPATGNSSAYTQLKIFMGMTFAEIEYLAGDARVHFGVDGGPDVSTPWSGDTRWWRFRQIGNVLQAELSSDSSTWRYLGRRTIDDPSPPLLGIIVGATQAGMSDSALIDNLNVCP